MTRLARESDRRRARRAPVHATAVVRGARGARVGALADLSLGGALVEVAAPEDAALELELRLPARAAITLTARVVRIERRERATRVALAFDAVPPDAGDAIEAAVTRALAAPRARTVLVIDDVAERRADVEVALREHALAPRSPRTPLEAIDALVADPGVELCVVGARFGGHRGDDFARFLADQFPWVRVLDIGGDVARLAADAAALGDAGPAGW